MTLEQKFNISRALKIQAIADLIMDKFFYKFDSVFNYC